MEDADGDGIPDFMQKGKNAFWHLDTASGLPKVIFLAVAEAEGEGGKTSALEVEAEGEAEGLVFCI